MLRTTKDSRAMTTLLEGHEITYVVKYGDLHVPECLMLCTMSTQP